MPGSRPLISMLRSPSTWSRPAQLLHAPQVVEQAPLLYYLATRNPVDRNFWETDRAPGRCDATELAPVRAGGGVARDDRVALGHHVFHGFVPVGKRRLDPHDALAGTGAAAPLRQVRAGREMAHEALGVPLVDGGEISGVPHLVESSHHRTRRHRRCLAAWAPQQLAPAVGARGAHRLRARRAERALVAADECLGVQPDLPAALLARRPHLERHRLLLPSGPTMPSRLPRRPSSARLTALRRSAAISTSLRHVAHHPVDARRRAGGAHSAHDYSIPRYHPGPGSVFCSRE